MKMKSTAGFTAWSFILVTLSAIVFAYVLFLTGQQGLYWDAHSYYTLGKQIAQEGLWAFNDQTRTYGYPLFIAVLWLVSDGYPSTVHFLVFNAQLAVFLSVCLYGAYVLYRLLGKITSALGVYVLTALNPFLLIYTTEVLSDLLSATLLFLAILLAIRTPTEGKISINTFLASLALGSATMIRPANLSVVFALIAILILRWWIFKTHEKIALVFLVLGLILPLMPQLVNNYRAFGKIQPLIVRNLYQEQLGWGMDYIKYVSIVRPGDARGITYNNPFRTDAITFTEFLLEHPLEFFLTHAIHLFALFDYDLAFPYIVDIRPWYRLPLAIINFTYLFGGLVGIGAWLYQRIRRAPFTRYDLALAGMLFGCLTYLPAYVLVAVEPRFSLPIYLLISPFVLYVLDIIWRWTQARQWKNIRVGVFAWGLFLIGMLSLSSWLQTQAPELNRLADSPDVLTHYTRQDLYARFGDRIVLTGLSMNQSVRLQGGSSLYLGLDWQCNGASTEPYDVQIHLLDSKHRVWAQAVHDTHDEISPCIQHFWKTTDRVIDVVTLRLPPTMPAGEYYVRLGLYDPNNERYLEVRDASGKVLGDQLTLLQMPIIKNRSSFTASQLHIEVPLFVDMQEMRLLGHTNIPNVLRAGEAVEIGLYWRAREKPRGDYIVVVQLRDSNGAIIVEQASRPAEDSYPTLEWSAGEVLLDWHTIIVPVDISPGVCTLGVLLQDSQSKRILGQRIIRSVTVE